MNEPDRFETIESSADVGGASDDAQTPTDAHDDETVEIEERLRYLGYID